MDVGVEPLSRRPDLLTIDATVATQYSMKVMMTKYKNI
jgi:hypothetical protein